MPIESLHPKVTASAGAPDMARLSEGDLQETTKLPIPAVGESAWIQYEFAEPQTMRSVTIAMKELDGLAAMLAGITSPEKTLEASDDGQNFRTIVKLPDGGAPEHTVSFPPVTAKFFRVVFKRTPRSSHAFMDGRHRPRFLRDQDWRAPTDYEIAELALHPGARVNRFEEKAAFTPMPDLYQFATPPDPTAEVVSKSDVVDLTSKLRADGTLDWTPPAGDWVVLRFGYSLLGITNHPATAGSHGPGSRQAEPQLREELHERLPGQLQADRGRGLHGQARHPVRG